MLGIKFIKAPPTVYVIQFKNGSIRRQGAGLTFWYFAPTSTLLEIPLFSIDLPFVFRDTTADFQDVSIQGQLTYKIADPLKVYQMVDFTVSPKGEYTSEQDPLE